MFLKLILQIGDGNFKHTFCSDSPSLTTFAGAPNASCPHQTSVPCSWAAGGVHGCTVPAKPSAKPFPCWFKLKILHSDLRGV